MKHECSRIQKVSFKEDKREHRIVQIRNRRVLGDDVRFLAVSADRGAGGLADGGDGRVLQDARAFFAGRFGEKVLDGGGAGEGDGAMASANGWPTVAILVPASVLTSLPSASSTRLTRH
jgi:hypothetical protein